MHKVLLVILDGWGHSEFGPQPDPANAVELARVPRFRDLYRTAPRGRLACSGLDVGVPVGQMGNSEVGHLNLGGGRIVDQDITRVDAAVADGSLATRLALGETVKGLKARGRALHVIGLVSDGGVHSHIRHFEGLFRALPKDLRVRVHCVTDGRDTSPTSGAGFVAEVERICARSPEWRIATVSGRYYAMDRDKRWERTKRAYDCIVCGKAETWEESSDFLARRYEEGVTDEFILPTGIRGAGESGLRPDDAVIFMNFRADRMRQITWAITGTEFTAFPRGVEPVGEAVTLTQYEAGLPARVAFPPRDVRNCLAEVISDAGMSQLKVAETEKYAHVTYFFNGGSEEPFQGEERVLIPSPKVATYDLRPEMSAQGVCQAVVEGLEGEYAFILVNFANPDMVGHTGSIPAAVKAVEAVDACLGQLLDRVASLPDWVALVTADHGNCERMLDAEGNVHTSHTTEPVDFMLYDPRGTLRLSSTPERLADVAPTVLTLMGLRIPAEMTGGVLVGPVD